MFCESNPIFSAPDRCSKPHRAGPEKTGPYTDKKQNVWDPKDRSLHIFPVFSNFSRKNTWKNELTKKKKHVFLWLTHVQMPYGLKFSQFLNRGPYGSQETHLAPETEKSEKIRILTAIIRNWFDVLRMNSDNFGAPLYLRYGLRNFKKTGFVLKVRYSEKSIARGLYRKIATQDIKIS